MLLARVFIFASFLAGVGYPVSSSVSVGASICGKRRFSFSLLFLQG